MKTILELLRNGKIKPGDKLIWKKRSLNKVFHATINMDGTVTLSSGEIFKSPSGAARFLNNGKPVDGWIVWKLETSGRSLGSLRA